MSDSVSSPKVETTGRFTVSRMYKDGNIITKEDSDEGTIEVRAVDPRVPLASVGYGTRVVVNMGGYETVTIELHVTLPSYVEELGEAYQAAKTQVERKLGTEVGKLKTYRDEKALRGGK